MDTPSLDGWTCPIPLQNYPTIVMGHGAGGKMMNDLIRHLFASELQNALLAQLADSTTLDLDGNRLAFSTDSFVVSPLFFPGGDIGELAVNGTVNDLAMSGARPLFLSAGFILEEGLPMETLGRIATSVAAACREAGVQLVAGDTKVVNKDHGMAIMSVREGLEFETVIESDTAPLNGLVQAMLAAAPGGEHVEGEHVGSPIHCLRDATRGGLAAVLNELAAAAGAGIEFDERHVPVRPAVHAACEMLGLDPLYTANEGKLVAIMPASYAEAVLGVMRAHPLGREAARIGQVVAGHPGLVVARTGIGGLRVVDLPAGELLPRIC